MPSQNLRCLIKSVAPNWLIQLVRKLISPNVDTKFKGLANAQLFNLIYAKGTWGKNENGEGTSGSGSHSSELVVPYIQAVRTYVVNNTATPRTIVDLGCGDFNIGSKLCDLAENYIACDVSSLILQRIPLQNFPQVAIRQLDITTDRLPEGDIAILRQVIQHLSNKDIQSFLNKIKEQQPYRYLIVTEHIPTAPFTANLDKPSGPNIRLSINSGVNLTHPPFNLNYVSRETICEVQEHNAGKPGLIRTVAYHLK